MAFFNTKSFLRQEQYRAIQNLEVNGEILDVGGSHNSGYLELIKGNHTVLVGNINDSYGIDINFDAEKPWPFENERFDCVLFINLLEHLFEYNNAVKESFRVLKHKGRVVGVVPFMFPIHGSPSDHFRFTRFSLERILGNAGFREIKITELGTGSFSVAYHVFIGFVRWNWLAGPLIALARLGDKILSLIKKENKMSKKFMTLGYYFEAEK